MRALRLLLAVLMPAALAVVAHGGVAASGVEPVGPTASTDPVRGVFYYPWFPQTWHDDDHYTPSRGRYSNDSPELLDAQFADMAYAGLDLAISSWWGHGTVTGNRLEPVMTAAENNGVSVVPYYEKEYGNQDPTVEELRSDLQGLLPLTKRPGWLHMDGKPVIFVYNSGATGCADVTRWRQATDGWTDFYVNLKLFSGFRDCPDQPQAWHQYGPSTSRSEHLPWSSNVSPGFWKHSEAAPRLVRDLSRFESDLRAQVASGAQWQLVTSYSEWGEGTAVESAKEWESPSGRGDYLDVMRAVYGGAPAGDAASRGTRLRLPARADAHVNAAEPRANYGSAARLAADTAPLKRSYIRFSVPTQPERVWLRVWSPRGNTDGITVRSASSRWREGTLTYRNAPDPGPVRGSVGAVRAGAWTSVEVTDAVRGSGTYSFVITSRRGAAVFNSTENQRRRPHLLLRSTSDSADEVVVWAAGDLCDDEPSPECGAVGSMIAADSAADHVLALGDLQYETGALAAFRQYYDPAMGNGPGLKSRTLPVVGNHEYLTTGAAGYFDYFGALAGDPAKGYYAKTLGAWRLVVTNTNCGQVGGCDPSDPQGAWIQEQLQSSPACTLVAGHHPAVTDGNYAPDTDAGRQMLEYAYAGRAELYLAGHDHEYQRFPLLDDALAPDPQRGVRTFVVGTGGKNLTGWSTTNRSEYRQNTDIGALRLVLRPGSYAWEFRNVDGQVMDQGAGTCTE